MPNIDCNYIKLNSELLEDLVFPDKSAVIAKMAKARYQKTARKLEILNFMNADHCEPLEHQKTQKKPGKLHEVEEQL